MLTEEQKKARRGKITASSAYKIMGAKGLGQGGLTYVRELIAEERGWIRKEASSSSIDHGNMYEPIAREAYADYLGSEIFTMDFIDHEKYEAGCTPDGYIRDLQCGLEIKSPENGGVHITFLEVKDAASLKAICSKTTSTTVKHLYWQVMFSIWVTGWDYWKFVSFHPEMNKDKLYVAEIHPVQSDIRLIEERVQEALQLKQDILKRIA
jgi:hypothetical protein